MNMNMNTDLVNKEGVDQLIEKMHSHVAWHGNITVENAEKVLKSFPAHTFLLRSGESDLHYFFSYVTTESVIFHKSVRVNCDLLGYYANAGGGCDRNKIYYTVEPLISEVVGYPVESLLPLSNELKHAQGF